MAENRRNRRYSHPVGKPFSIRLPADLEQELERRVAEKPGLKRNAVITAAVREGLAAIKEKK